MTDNRSVPFWRQYPKSTAVGVIGFAAFIAMMAERNLEPV